MSLKNKIISELSLLFKLKETTRTWHIPLLATICIGTPLMVGLYFDDLKHALISSLSGLVILYLPDSGSITNRILTVLVCSFGFMISFTFGLLFSFNPVVSILALGVFSFTVHWIILYYKTSPPRSFFFILIASMAICQPFDLQLVPVKIGLMGLGTMFACILALVYILSLSFQSKIDSSNKVVPVFKRNSYADFWEAIITGVFMFLALAFGKLLKFENPYWIPISSAAVMQGASLYHIWQRSFHRILGTFIGLGLCWGILMLVKTPFHICLAIIILQFIIEILVVRQYALAVIFITPMTILLAEASNPLIGNPNTLISIRFMEIFIGSILGAIGGWVLYKEKLRYSTIKGVKKIRVGLRTKT